MGLRGDSIEEREADRGKAQGKGLRFLLAPMLIRNRKGTGDDVMGVRILIVDDSAAMRHGVRYVLETHDDWEICGEAADGAEAIEKYRELRPDLLVVDVSMPVMNGLDASLEILKLAPKILILLYTSFLTQELIETAHLSGIRGTLSKDCTELLVGGIEALLRGEEFSGPSN
jgi:DNA-binding NarL/FixJ family response regulator